MSNISAAGPPTSYWLIGCLLRTPTRYQAATNNVGLISQYSQDGSVQALYIFKYSLPLYSYISLWLPELITVESRLALKGQQWQENWPHHHLESSQTKIKTLALLRTWIADIYRRGENNSAQKQESHRERGTSSLWKKRKKEKTKYKKRKKKKKPVTLLCGQKLYTVILGVDDKKMGPRRQRVNERRGAIMCERLCGVLHIIQHRVNLLLKTFLTFFTGPTLYRTSIVILEHVGLSLLDYKVSLPPFLKTHKLTQLCFGLLLNRKTI